MAARDWRRVLDAAAEGAGEQCFSDLLAAGRARRLSMWRQVTMLVLRNGWGMSYPEVALIFKRDHTSVVHGVKKSLHSIHVRKDPDWLDAYQFLLESIEAEPIVRRLNDRWMVQRADSPYDSGEPSPRVVANDAPGVRLLRPGEAGDAGGKSGPVDADHGGECDGHRRLADVG
jgi:hypothetical protein